MTVPRTFGRYHLFDRIGAGGMAEIYLARARTELGGARLAVVKQILPELSGNDRFSEMLIAEAKLAARLSHANVVQVFDLGRNEGILFIAMEYVEGFDLNELLRKCAKTKTPLPVHFALLIVCEALRGLDYAHRRTDDRGVPIGIVHRDVSPSNVLISFEGEIKLCDFGIARANDMADVLPEDAIKGKAGYMSPEQARGETLDARADVFAIGIILWELLAGRKLYRAQPGEPSLLDQARAAQIADLPSRGLQDEATLYGIVKRALAPQRADRYPSAQAMLRDLEDYMATVRMVASPIRLGEWLRDQFGEQLVASRRSRELAAKALEVGPAATVEPIPVTPAPPAPRPDDEVSGERSKTGTTQASPHTDALADTATQNSSGPGLKIWIAAAVILAVAVVVAILALR